MLKWLSIFEFIRIAASNPNLLDYEIATLRINNDDTETIVEDLMDLNDFNYNTIVA